MKIYDNILLCMENITPYYLVYRNCSTTVAEYLRYNISNKMSIFFERLNTTIFIMQ